MPNDIIVLAWAKLGLYEFCRRLRSVQDDDHIILNGALGFSEGWRDLFVATYLRFAKRRVRILITDATWHPRTTKSDSRFPKFYGFYCWLQKRLLLLSEGPHTHYCFLSTSERQDFALGTGVPLERVHFTKFCTQFPDSFRFPEDESSHKFSREAPLKMFAGGNSLRDYHTLLTAIKDTGLPITVATSLKIGNVPEEADVRWQSQAEFFENLSNADVVVIPLIGGLQRSVGQQTYLNAMALGCHIVVSDVIGVRDHLTPGVHATVVPAGDPSALRQALLMVNDKKNTKEVANIARNGQVLARNRSFGMYVLELFDLLKSI